jgi:hypothetical protein
MRIYMKLRKSIYLILLATSLIPFAANLCQANPYPRDNLFKALNYHRDLWFYTDDRWEIKAPDKWTHFMGSYSLNETIRLAVKDKYLSGIISFAIGCLKEYDDAYREGWSQRDLYMDLAGNLSSFISSRDLKILCYYDTEKVLIKGTVLIDKIIF